MASIPFSRGLSRESSSYVYTDGDDTIPPPRDKDIVDRSSSGVESCRNVPKSHKKQSNSPKYTSTSDDGPSTSSGIKVTRSRKQTKPRRAYIASPKPLYGSCQEKQPLLQHDNGQKCPEEIVVDISSEGSESTNPETSSGERFFSVVGAFLLPLIAGLTFIVSVNVNTDRVALEISPAVFHYYTVGLISVYMILLAIVKYFEGSKSKASQRQGTKEFKPLIPSHLLNGLALFGACSSAFQAIMIVDFAKCSRSISGLDKSYIVSAVFEIMFVFCQMYMFYTLSKQRKQKLWFGNYFTMFTLAVNLTLWAGYFCAGAVNHPDLKNVTWLRRYYYGKNEDFCAGVNNTGKNSRSLHEFVSTMMQYKFTFAMEYSLLASALLLHLWLGITTPAAGEFGAANKKWVVWRFGFMLGLFSLPLMGVVACYSTVEYSLSNAVFLYVVQCGLFALVLLCSIVGLTLFKFYYTRDRDTKPLKVDIILLCFSALGFIVIDFFTIFATAAETFKSHSPNEGSKIMLGATSIGELVTICALTTFIVASYFYRAPTNDAGLKATMILRQITSFCIIVSFGFWAMRTYTFRSSRYFDVVGRDYFGKIGWFVITQFSSPMCIFYHFHCAVCLSEILADSTVAGRQVTS